MMIEPRRSNVSRRFEPAGNRRSTAARSLRLVMPTSIDRRARLDELRGDERGPADRRHEDVRLGGDRRQIRRARVTDRHRRVAVQQQQRHRLADDVAAADDDGALSGDRNSDRSQQLDDARRRARRRAARRSAPAGRR